MKIKLVILSLALVSMTGCAALQPHTDGSPNKTRSVAKHTAIGAGIGCAAGAVLGKLLGTNPGKGCAAGAVMGGVAGATYGVEHYKKQKAQYDAMVAQARAAGLNAELKTREVQDAKTHEKTTAVDRLVIHYDPADMRAQTRSTKATLSKLGALIAKAQKDQPQSVELDGKDLGTCIIPATIMADDLTGVQINNQCGQVDTYAIVVSPNPLK